jgi:hypothetical protein
MIPLKNLLINNNGHKILCFEILFQLNSFISNRLIHFFNIDYDENIKSTGEHRISITIIKFYIQLKKI